jgi:hypothetical protein
VGKSKRPLKEGDSGPYGDLAGRTLPEGSVLLFVPSLAALLTRAEELKDAPLTKEQVLLIRDAAHVVVSPPQPASAVEKRRGYADVDPTNAWKSWKAIRGGVE